MLTSPVKKSVSGFTILELAIVLLIVAALTASLLGPFTNYLYQRQVAETDKSLDEIKEALLGFAAANGRLPYPGLTGVGLEDATTCTGTNNSDYCSGVIPWQVLGIARTDAWNKPFRYSVSYPFADPSKPIKFTLQDKSSLSVNMRDPGAAGLVSIASKVPTIVWSAGRRNTGVPANVDEITNENLFTHNLLPIKAFVVTRQYAEAGAVGGEFDDLVVWVPAPVLFNRLLSAGQTLN
ncbi:MAG: type II secretion system protein [Burkholderiaceae bacterium]|nr:MAG: type II secretion system protein [Burkholderiaceae bacterium]